MGYYTKYKLTAEYISNPMDAIMALRGRNENAALAIAGEPCMWHKYREDMLVLSLEHPGILFTIRGEGEKAKDIWADYYFGGKVQHEDAKVTVGEFDESKLKAYR